MPINSRLSSSVLIILSTAFLGQEVAASNILFFVGFSSYSHRIIVWPLVESLAQRGHNVTFLSPYPPRKPSGGEGGSPSSSSVHEVNPPALVNWMTSMSKESQSHLEVRQHGNLKWRWYNMYNVGVKMCQELLSDVDFVEWVQDNKFDLVVVVSLMNECAYGIAHFHNAKIIVFNTANPFPWFIETMGLPDESSWIPDQVFHFPPTDHGLNFGQRLVSFLNPLYFLYLHEFHYFPMLESIIANSKLGARGIPSLSQIERKNVSLFLINHHFSEDYPRALPPNVIPVGGMHCTQEVDTLPAELQNFLDKEADLPVVYISFGSYADISRLPSETRSVFLNVIGNLTGVKVIWKMDGDRPEKLPQFVYTASWISQQSVLAHPQVQLFITHGGLLGIQEAIFHSVPMIVFPLFAEQDYNAEKILFRKVGLKLEITSVTEDQLAHAIQTVLSNDGGFKERTKKLSKLFKERPMTPTQTALWWTEFVLNNDPDMITRLKPTSVNQRWFVRRNLDIWSLLAGMVLCLIAMVCWGIMKCSRVLRNGTKLKAKLHTS